MLSVRVTETKGSTAAAEKQAVEAAAVAKAQAEKEAAAIAQAEKEAVQPKHKLRKKQRP